MSDPYAIVLRDGKKVDALTDAAMKRAEAILGRKIPVTQGSYNAGGVAASAGTHDGGGCVDVPAWEHDEVVTALRAVGFAAWYRPTLAGVWPAHCHAVLIGHAKLAPVAFRQVQAYLARRDGLAGNGPDLDPGWTGTARYTVEAFRLDVAAEVKRAERLAKLEKSLARKAKWQRWVTRANANIARLRDLTKG